MNPFANEFAARFARTDWNFLVGEKIYTPARTLMQA
jgi:hypothetical protein